MFEPFSSRRKRSIIWFHYSHTTIFFFQISPFDSLHFLMQVSILAENPHRCCDVHPSLPLSCACMTYGRRVSIRRAGRKPKIHPTTGFNQLIIILGELSFSSVDLIRLAQCAATRRWRQCFLPPALVRRQPLSPAAALMKTCS